MFLDCENINTRICTQKQPLNGKSHLRVLGSVWKAHHVLNKNISWIIRYNFGNLPYCEFKLMRNIVSEVRICTNTYVCKICEVLDKSSQGKDDLWVPWMVIFPFSLLSLLYKMYICIISTERITHVYVVMKPRDVINKTFNFFFFLSIHSLYKDIKKVLKIHPLKKLNI